MRPATLHLTNYLNGHKSEVHVCHECALEHGYIEKHDEPYTIHDLLSGLFHHEYGAHSQPTQPSHTPHAESCPNCQMTYQQFVNTGKFGCAYCYDTFSQHLNPILRRVHSGNVEHVGKVPERQHVHLQKKRVIQSYREQLNQLIQDEEFEEAARVRDKIKALENGEDHREDERGADE